MVTYSPNLDDDTKVTVSIIGSNIGSSEYIAFGLSEDAKMGDDLVFVCHGGSKVSQNFPSLYSKMSV